MRGTMCGERQHGGSGDGRRRLAARRPPRARRRNRRWRPSTIPARTRRTTCKRPPCKRLPAAPPPPPGGAEPVPPPPERRLPPRRRPRRRHAAGGRRPAASPGTSPGYALFQAGRGRAARHMTATRPCNVSARPPPTSTKWIPATAQRLLDHLQLLSAPRCAPARGRWASRPVDEDGRQATGLGAAVGHGAGAAGVGRPFDPGKGLQRRPWPCWSRSGRGSRRPVWPRNTATSC